MQPLRKAKKGVDSSDMRIVTGCYGFGAHFRHNSMRTVGLAMAVLLAMAQAGALVHFALVGHALSLATGTLIHSDHDIAPSPSDGTPTHSRHETCEIFAVLHQAVTVESPVLTVATPDVVIHDWPRVFDDRDRVSAWPMYRVAPSHSPPGLAV